MDPCCMTGKLRHEGTADVNAALQQGVGGAGRAPLAPRASVWGHGDEECSALAVGAGTSLSHSHCEGNDFPIERT